MKYIHYGQNSFDPEKFNCISNTTRCISKPKGGLWASPVESTWGWKNWCESEHFYVERLENSFTFELSPDARICHLRSVIDLEKLPLLGIEESVFPCYLIDFEKAMETYDAIELHLSEEEDGRYMEGLYYALYGWDCDSILIMNPDVIILDK